MTNAKKDRLNYDPDDKERYDFLKSELLSPPENYENKDLFIFAMTYGFNAGSPKALTRKKGFVRVEYLNNTDKALINSVAVASTNNLDIVGNDDKNYEIAEEFAHAGIILLADELKDSQPGLFAKEYEKLVLKLFESMS